MIPKYKFYSMLFSFHSSGFQNNLLPVSVAFHLLGICTFQYSAGRVFFFKWRLFLHRIYNMLETIVKFSVVVVVL